MKSTVYMLWLTQFIWGNLYTILAATIVSFLLIYNYKRYRLVRLIGKIPGLPALPFIGNSIEINVEHDEILERIAATASLWGRKYGLCKGWFGTKPYIFINKASSVEPILGSIKHIEKSDEYVFLHPWLGTGLLTSSGQKWHTRRKILTPAFHFKILDDFMEIFVEQSCILTTKLGVEVGGKPFNIIPYITHCTLDIICETAMGQKVKAQEFCDSEYVKAVYKIGSIIQSRQAKIWLQPEWIFKMTNYYKEHQQCIEVLHNFSNKVIQERKLEWKNKASKVDSSEKELGLKERKAFLDLLIEASHDGAVLSDEDIREEVDTFMFEGHDTTSAAIGWLILLLGHDQKIQDKVAQEIKEIIGDSNRAITMKDLSKMKYLECCIKECLRLYPSVPIYARKLNEDVSIGEYKIPAGTSAMIVAYQIHRDPLIFPNPDKFNPENFETENVKGRHPYAFIPFSAGPRNCIGQKFAIMEVKIVISAIIRQYRIISCDRRENLTLLGELVLRSKNGIHVQLYRREE